MNNLLYFLMRYHAYFMFVILEAISFSFIVRSENERQRSVLLSTSSRIVGFINEKYDNFVSYWKLPEENEQLKKENASLRSQLKTSQFVHTFDTTGVKDTMYEQQYAYVPAEVISNTVHQQNNYLTLNRGARHGIEPNMAVIASNGIVGIVIKTSKNYATVLSLLHSETRVSAEILRSHYHGSLVWRKKDPRYMTLEAIPKQTEILKNDTVVCTGFSAIFPTGYMIGTVDSIIVPSGSNFYELEVKLSEDFYKIKHVYVVRDLFKGERTALEVATFKNEELPAFYRNEAMEAQPKVPQPQEKPVVATTTSPVAPTTSTPPTNPASPPAATPVVNEAKGGTPISHPDTTSDN